MGWGKGNFSIFSWLKMLNMDMSLRKRRRRKKRKDLLLVEIATGLILHCNF